MKRHLSTHVMSIFLLLTSLSGKIKKIMNSFWLGHNQDQIKGNNWISWNRLSMYKNNGGMGFKNLSTLNYVMFGKQDPKFVSFSDNLILCLFKAKYFSRSDFLKSVLGNNPNYV